MKKELIVLGVPGTLTAERKNDHLWQRQKWNSVPRPIADYGKDAIMQVQLRFDDECGNNHNTFSITADVTTPASRRRNDIEAGGCMHDEIGKVFPELASLIKWHLTSSDGPLHYIANTVYHAGDRDHWGLRKGEKRQRHTNKGLPMWELRAINSFDFPLRGADTTAPDLPIFTLETLYVGDKPPVVPQLQWLPSVQVGEGKDRDLNAARHTAVWPEATDEELSAEPSILKAKLMERHAGVTADFKTAMIGCGFSWEPVAGEGY